MWLDHLGLLTMPSCKATCCLISAAAIGCEAQIKTGPGPIVGDEVLVDYAGPMRKLFDNELGGVALANTWDDSLAEGNSLLSKRVLSAGSILRCSVGTVTEGSVDQSIAASVEFRSPGVSLLTENQEQCPKIIIASSSYSYSVLRQYGASLVGKTVVVFLHNFHENGGTSWHWHVEPDRPDIRDLVVRLRGPTK